MCYTSQDWIETSFRFLKLPQRVLQHGCWRTSVRLTQVSSTWAVVWNQAWCVWTSNLRVNCIRVCPQREAKGSENRSKERNLIGYGSGNIYRVLTKKTKKLITGRDVKFDENLLGYGSSRNEAEPLYIYGDDEKKDAQESATCTERISSIASKRCQEARRGKKGVQGRW